MLPHVTLLDLFWNPLSKWFFPTLLNISLNYFFTVVNSKMLFLLGLSNLPRIIIACDFFLSQFKPTKGTLPLLQNRYPNTKTTSHIKLRFFLWTKLLENLLLAVNLTSVAVTSSFFKISSHYWYDSFLQEKRTQTT